MNLLSLDLASLSSHSFSLSPRISYPRCFSACNLNSLYKAGSTHISVGLTCHISLSAICLPGIPIFKFLFLYIYTNLSQFYCHSNPLLNFYCEHLTGPWIDLAYFYFTISSDEAIIDLTGVVSRYVSQANSLGIFLK